MRENVWEQFCQDGSREKGNLFPEVSKYQMEEFLMLSWITGRRYRSISSNLWDAAVCRPEGSTDSSQQQ
jgi:hypothetical protein